MPTISPTAERNKRLGITLTPEVHRGIKSLAALAGMSLNDYVFSLLEREVKQNVAGIQKIVDAREAYQKALFEFSDSKKNAAE